MTAYDNMRALLRSCKLEAVAHRRETMLKTVPANARAAFALQMMGDERILSVPVVDVDTNEFAGVFSVNDALRHLCGEMKLDNANRDLTKEEVVSAMHTLGEKTVSSLMHNGDLWYVKGTDPSVMDAVKDMLTDSSVHHRLFVCNSLKDTRPTGILSQSDIVRIMYEHRVEFGDLLQASVAQLGLCSAAAETVAASEPTVRVIVNMYRDRKSCMGVTDGPGGELIGNLSASDLRFVTPDMYAALMAPVGEFILRMRKLQVPSGPNVDWKAALAQVEIKSVTPSTTLEEVLRLLTENHLHRLYVRNDEQGCIGIITLTDLLRPLAPFASAAPCEGPAGGLPVGEMEADDMDVSKPEVTAA